MSDKYGEMRWDFSGTFMPGPNPTSQPPLMTVEQARTEGERMLLFTGPSPYGWHSVALYLRCPSLYDFLKVSCVETEDAASTDYLTRGTLVHVGLAHHYLRWGIVQRKGLLHDEIIRRNPDDYYTPLAAVALAAEKMAAAGDPHAMPLLPLAQRILRNYLDRVAAVSYDRDVRVYAVEQVATIMCGQYPFTARLDLVVEVPDGIMIWDHKILARPKEVVRMYSDSGQIHGHRMIGRTLWGNKFRGSKLNAIPADPDDKNLYRATPTAAPGLVDAFPQTIMDAHSQMEFLRKARPAGQWPRSMNCVDRHGRCPAWEHCAGFKKWVPKDT